MLKSRCYDAEDLLGLAPADLKIPVDMREIIARIVDGSQFHEFKPAYGTEPDHRLGLALRLRDRHSGQSARRAVFGRGSEGVAVHPTGQPARRAAGVHPERHRLHGRQAIRAGGHHQARCPHDQRRVEQHGAAPDAANRRLVRRGQLRHVRLCLSAAVRVHLAQQQDGRDGARSNWPACCRSSAAPPRKPPANRSTKSRTPCIRQAVEEQIEKESLATFTSGQVYDDGIIDPRDSRTVLGIALSAALSAEVKGAETFGVFRM